LLARPTLFRVDQKGPRRLVLAGIVVDAEHNFVR